jgi:hypothetical protein
MLEQETLQVLRAAMGYRIRDEVDKWSKLANRAGIKAE